MPAQPRTIRDFLPPFSVQPNLNTSVRTGSKLTLVSVIFQGAMRFLTSAAVGRLGGPSALGTYQSALSTAQLLCLLGPTSNATATAKFVARARGRSDMDEVHHVASHLMRRALQASLGLGFAAIPAWLLIGDGPGVGALTVGLLVATLAGYHFSRGLQFGAGRADRVTLWDVTTALIASLAVVVCLLMGLRGLTLLLPLAGSYLIFTLAAWPKYLSLRDQKLPRPVRRELDGFIALGIVGTLASAGFLQFSMVLARAIGDASSAGQYAAAFTLATPPAIISSSISLALFPSMAAAWGRGDIESGRRQTDQATSGLLSIMVPLVGSLIIFSSTLTSLVWGEDFESSSELLPLILFAVLFVAVAVPSVNSLTSKNQRGMAISASSSCLGLLVGILVWLLLVPALGNLGIAIGYLAGSIVNAGIPISIAWWTQRQQWLALGVKLAIGISMLAASRLIAAEYGHSWQLSTIQCAVFITTWCLLTQRDLRSLAKSR